MHMCHGNDLGARKAGEAMNVVRPDAPANSRSIQVVIDRLIDGFAVEVSMIEGEQARVLAETTVASFVEAENMACAHAAEHNFPWHKVAVICR